jgi:hypothetical protein
MRGRSASAEGKKNGGPKPAVECATMRDDQKLILNET